MAKKKDKQRLFTVGPGTQHVQHSRDRKNYWPGQTFDLDHLDEATQQMLVDKGAVVDVTSKSQEDIDRMVKLYPQWTWGDVVKAIEEAANSG